MNYFAYETAARRYAASRPYFHPLVIGKIRDFLKLEQPVQRALDVACGTGQSTIALTQIAREIVGVEVSPEMLGEAPRDPRIEYIVAPAEQLPLPNASYNLVTVSLAFHWFERARFLAEAARVLRPGGWLVIYNNGFTGRMRENPDFEHWNRDSYLARYPVPPRNSQPLTDADLEPHGFRFLGRESYTNDVPFSREELASYLMTQSNIIAAVEQGNESPQDVYTWLLGSLAPVFIVPRGTFQFGGGIEYLQK